jgi:hypothetical protein
LSWNYSRLARAFLRCLFKQTMRTPDANPRVARIGHDLKTFSSKSSCSKQKLAQQHSGDWALTGKCPSRGQKALIALARNNRKDESHSAHRDHGRIAGR